jgi:hypothetical protein
MKWDYNKRARTKVRLPKLARKIRGKGYDV